MAKNEDDEFDDEAISRAGCEIVFEALQGLHAGLFAFLQEEMPKLAEELREDYEAWIRAEAEIFKEMKGEGNVDDIRRRLPGNKWGAFFCKKTTPAASPLSEKQKSAAGEGLRERVARRLLGIDIN